MTTKAALQNALETLTEAELRQVADLVRSLQRRRGLSPTLSHLAADPAFRVRSQRRSGFRSADPVEGKGAAASVQLVRDRR